jgi:hypothetical protein
MRPIGPAAARVIAHDQKGKDTDGCSSGTTRIPGGGRPGEEAPPDLARETPGQYREFEAFDRAEVSNRQIRCSR